MGGEIRDMRGGESAPVCVVSVLDLYALLHSTLFAFLSVSLDFFPFLASFHKTISLESTYFDFLPATLCHVRRFIMHQFHLPHPRDSMLHFREVHPIISRYSR